MFDRLKEWTQQLKTETAALYFACRDPRTPWYAKALALFVVAHTLSPIDLIPDFIPILGYLDDLIITPLGLAIAFKLIPEDVLAEARRKAGNQLMDGSSLGRAGMVIVFAFWTAGLLLIALIAFRIYSRAAHGSQA
jgi:uncharacterized membrane protein YkvA (DUF1232 family)